MHQLIEGNAQRVEVHPPIGAIAAQGLGREVSGSAGRKAVLPLAQHQPKVDQVRLAVWRDDHVLRLEIAVHHSGAMERIENLGGVAADAADLGYGQPSAVRLEVLSLDQIAGEEVAGFADCTGQIAGGRNATEIVDPGEQRMPQVG